MLSKTLKVRRRHRYGKKKLKKTMKRKITNRKMKKFTHKGGLGEILGQGTHGQITIDPNDETKVIKSFKSVNSVKYCVQLQNEYTIQSFLSREFSNNNLCVMVPFADSYVYNGNVCSYRMDRIMPLHGYSYYLIPSLINDNYEKPFLHSTSGMEVGLFQLRQKYGIDPSHIVRCIGEMFSYLHYVLLLDGYDCEIIIGGDNQLYLIDYDKIQYIEFVLGYVAYRKIDETIIEEKHLTTVQKFARFLYSAMGSMSLIPVNEELKAHFIEGYRRYSLRNNELSQDICEHVIQEINWFTL